MTRDQIIAFVILIEGGYVNDPDDTGGATKYGVTQRYLDSRRNHFDGMPASVADLTTDQAATLYATDQWLEVHADELPPPLQLMALDCAVNQGGPEACILMQGCVGAKQDGNIGPVTLAAIHAADPMKLLMRFAVARDLRYAAGNAKYVRGWIRRLVRVYTACLLDRPVTDF